MGDVSLSGVLFPGGGGRSPPPVDRTTDASKNIILPQTSFAGGKYNHTADPQRVRLGCTRYRFSPPTFDKLSTVEFFTNKTKLAIMAILAPEALPCEKNPVTKCYFQWE